MQPSYRTRRGSMYVAVLMTAIIVAVIGISGLAVTRIQLRSTDGASQVTAARFYAQSAVEMGLHSINADPDWRTTYPNDTWEPRAPIGLGAYTWKLVDEQDGDLADDPTQPVRLYGKGVAGDTVRMYSVLVCEEDPGASNLLSNPGMESGTADWEGYDCTIVEHTSDQHSGAKSLRARYRVSYWAGPYQDVTDKIEIGTTYGVAAWMKMSSGGSPGRIVMWVGRQWPWEGYGGQWLVGDDVWVGDSEWTKVTAELTPTWDGTLNAAFMKIGTSSGSTTFYADDALLRVAGTSSRVLVIPGTWQRVVE